MIPLTPYHVNRWFYKILWALIPTLAIHLEGSLHIIQKHTASSPYQGAHTWKWSVQFVLSVRLCQAGSCTRGTWQKSGTSPEVRETWGKGQAARIPMASSALSRTQCLLLLLLPRTLPHQPPTGLTATGVTAGAGGNDTHTHTHTQVCSNSLCLPLPPLAIL